MKRFAALVLAWCVAGCVAVESNPTAEAPARLRVPPGFAPVPEPAHNRVTAGKAALGERLFFDLMLSRDQTISCGSCHVPDLAFSDGRPVSKGVEGRSGLRNAPSLVNVAYRKLFFLDGGALTLENQVFGPLEDKNEMDIDLAEALDRLNAHPSYREAFERVFDAPPTLRTLTQALAAYQRTIRSGGSRYDRHRAGDKAALTPAEKRGLAFFEGKGGCATCHGGFLLASHAFENNGLAFAGGDSGRARITHNPEDFGKFRVPSLRNAALTAPYMHDGRLPTLESVVEHYDRGGDGVRGQHPAVRPLNMAAMEKADLVAFLESLTDESVLTGLEAL